MKALEIIERENPAVCQEIRRIDKRIGNLKKELNKKLESQILINRTLSGRIEKIKTLLERKAKNGTIQSV